MTAPLALFVAAAVSCAVHPARAFLPPVPIPPSRRPSAAALAAADGDDAPLVDPLAVAATGHDDEAASSPSSGVGRRRLLSSVAASALAVAGPLDALAEGDAAATVPAPEPPVEVAVSGDARPLFNEARALELQGRIEAAQRLYSKVTKISPRFVYGWSNLGNTQVALGQLGPADVSYTTAVDLCRAKNADGTGRKCNDLYLILLNRGSLRLNDGRPAEALRDLEEADALRGRPDAVVLQNRARAREVNGLYGPADRDYTVAISMTSNEVAPFWLRAALVKYQLDDRAEAINLLRRVEVRFPEAPEVRAASAAMLAGRGDMDGARRKYLEIPDRQRLKFSDRQYLTKVVSWPPAMMESLAAVSKAVGDSP